MPLDLRNKAIEEAHATLASGHLVMEKTHARLALLYYWPGMFRDVATYVRACQICQQMKVEQAGPAGLMGKRVIEQPWTTVAADIMGPLPLSREAFSYVLVFQDMFTKWIEIVSLRKANGRSVQKAFQDVVVFRWGTPEILFTDNGTELVNNLIAKAAAELGIRHTTTPPYHAQANPVERMNRVIKTMIASFVDNDNRSWDKQLPDFRFAYNTAVHSLTHVSPAFLNFGREPRLAKSLKVKEEDTPSITPLAAEDWEDRVKRILALRDLVTHNLDISSDRQAKYYNQKRRDVRFNIKDVVWRKLHVLSSATDYSTRKLATKYEGPFKVVKVLSPVN